MCIRDRTSSALLCMSHDQVAEYEPSACIRCGRCIDACPSNVIPQKMMLCADRGDYEGFEKLDGMECCECGSCTFVCPAKRRLTQAFKQAKMCIRDRNIAFPPASLFGRGQTSQRHIPHIHEIISALHTGRQLSVYIVLYQLDKMISGRIVWPQDAGGMHYYQMCIRDRTSTVAPNIAKRCCTLSSRSRGFKSFILICLLIFLCLIIAKIMQDCK